MFKTILVPTDGSSLAGKAVDAAVKFAKEVDGNIVAISVSEPHPYALLSDSDFFGNTHGFEEKARDVAKDHVQRVADAASAAGVPCKVVVAHSFRPYEEMLKAAQTYNCDAIFMASHGRKGLGGLFLGSETQKVLTHSTIPVVVYR
jgi:nucleotide-binding universal stress UspA family protein